MNFDKTINIFIFYYYKIYFKNQFINLGGVNSIVCLFDLTKYIGNKMLMLIGYEPTSLNPSITQ